MIKVKAIFLLQFFLYSYTCMSQNDSGLIGSVWVKKGELCSDSLFFHTYNNYQEYYCEFDEYVNGKYKIAGDTLTLIEYKMSSEVAANAPESLPTYIWKYSFLKEGLLQKVYYEDIHNASKSFSTENTWEYVKVK